MEINKAAAELSKLSHKKSPRTKQFYKELSRKGVEARLRKKKSKV